MTLVETLEFVQLYSSSSCSKMASTYIYCIGATTDHIPLRHFLQTQFGMPFSSNRGVLSFRSLPIGRALRPFIDTPEDQGFCYNGERCAPEATWPNRRDRNSTGS